MNGKFNVSTIAFIFALFYAVKGMVIGLQHGDPNSAVASELVAATFIIISIVIKKIFYRE
ncbi:MAG: hypothetical protein E7254_05540 [Lachnospiraceae bacterium]|nr:hypothetical protein [Lachnospiraceae bacterium]